MIFDSRAARLRILQDGPRIRLRQEPARIRLDELMTFAGLILWVLQAYIDDSGFGAFFGAELGKLIRYFILLLFLVRILLSDMHIAARAVSAAAVFFCYLMMIQKMAGAGITFLQLFVVMMAVKDISFKRICKVMFWSCLFCYLSILFFDGIGLISLPPLIDGDRVRYYMGFRFVSFPSFYIFNLLFCGAYAYTGRRVEAASGRTGRRRSFYAERLPLWALAALELLNILVYVRTNTNIPFIITTFFVLLYLLCVYGGADLFPDCGPMRFLAGICYPALAFFTWQVVVHYNPNSKTWLKIDDKLTHFRIRHAAEGLKRYGIHPFGQVIYQNGDLQSPNYFYIDSAYMKILINYGLVFAVFLLGIYAMISVAAVRNRDTVLCIWMVCIAGFSLMNNVLYDPEQCCTLFAFWYAAGIWKRYGRGSRMRNARGSGMPPDPGGPGILRGGPPRDIEKRRANLPAGKSGTAQAREQAPAGQPSIKLNFVLSMAYQILIVILPLLTAPYLARVLGAAKSGIYSFTASYQTYFSMFAALGTVTYGAREIARNRADRAVRSRLFWEIELMTVVTSTLSILAFIVFIYTRDRYRIYYIPQIMAVLAVMFDISWFFTGIEQFKYTVTKNAFFKLLGVILIFALVHKPEDLMIYIIILSASTMLGNLSMWLYMPRFLDPVDFRTLRIRRHLRETMVYFVPTIATSVYTVLDKTLIGEITRDEAENGFYENVVKLINIMKALTFTALNSVLGARISYLFAEKKYDEIRQRIETSINYILFMGLGICFGLSGIAPRFIPWFLGPGYERSIWMLILMSPIVVIIGVSNCLGSQYYTPAGKRAQSARFIIAGSCVNLCMNLLLIPRYWGYGAIAASLMAEFTIAVLYVAFSGESFHPVVLLRDGWKKLAAAVLMFVVIRLIDPFFHANFPALLAEICLGGTVYIAVLFILRDRFMTGFCVDLVRGFLKKRGKRP
ncbi:MAG: flippase [Eubacteriales bacterium]|nr:flippase [Eubacteriales bacterium]